MTIVRVATYNVHGHKGMDRRVSAERPLEVLRHIDADVVALQEFVDGTAASGEPLLEHWAHSLGMHATSAPAFERGGELFATAILSKFPILERHEHDISLPGYRRRVLLDVLLAAPAARVRALSIHLGVSPRERALQAERVAAIAAAESADVDLLLGDFNEWHGFGPVGRRLRARFSSGRLLATFPAASPVLPLDRIWARPGDCLLDTRVERTPVARRASDHLPLVGTIDLAAVPADEETFNRSRP